MDKVKVEQVIKERSDKYLACLDQVDINFLKKTLNDFLLSDSKRCLVIETFDTKGTIKRIVKLLRDLKKNFNDNKTLEKYLTNKNQTFLEWMELFDVVRLLTVLPKFTNFLLCEFSNSVPLEDSESNVLSKIIERYNINISKKIIFLTSKKDYLNSHLKGFETQAFVKVDEFNKKVTSSIYKNKEEWYWECVTRGYVNDVEELLESGIDANLVREEDKFTALHIAAEKGYRDLVFTLLRYGTNILPNENNTTPLHLAARNGHNDVVVVLLENDADVDVTEYGGQTALHAAAENHNDVVKTLLRYGVNVNAKNPSDWTPLHTAVYKNKLDIVETLLQYGANVNAKSNSAWTALHIAAEENKLDIVETLLNHRASIYFKNSDRYTPLHCAAANGNCEIVKVLIQKRAPLDITDSYGDTPLHIAARNNFDEIVEILAESGANIHITNKGDETALDIAIRNKHINIISLLEYKTK